MVSPSRVANKMFLQFILTFLYVVLFSLNLYLRVLHTKWLKMLAEVYSLLTAF